MILNVYSIEKKEKDTYAVLTEDLAKMSKKYARLEYTEIFNKQINKAQNASAQEAQASYSAAFAPYVKNAYNIALHPAGKELDSHEFSALLGRHDKVNFFIGGAYGFNDAFLNQCDAKISLAKITMSHKVAKVVLFEQIFRGLSILKGHPYHK